jgi:oligopeptide/dipeptide ABC transporter ATP-binding protein
LIEPTNGKIRFQGQNVLGLSEEEMQELRREMQIIFQDPYGCLTPRLRISTLLREPLDVHAIGDPKERDDSVASMMQKVGLRPEHAHRYPHEFSGGQRQRISIARALLLSPRLIIADEPVSALDVSIRAQVLNLMADLQKEYELSYLLISHDLSVVKYMSDHVAVMYLGKIVEMAPREELYNNCMHPYTKALLSAIPIPAIQQRPQRILLKGDIPSPTSPPSGCRFRTRCTESRKVCSGDEPETKDLGNGHFVACHMV